MVIPTFERSLDLFLDNDFELTEEEIEQLMQLLNDDKELMQKIDSLVETINPEDESKDILKNSIKTAINTYNGSLEQLYDKIIKDTKVISFIQEILLKRMIN